jgi:hypothetical protein
VEVESNTSTAALRVVEGEEKGIRCLGVKLCHPVTGEHEYRHLVLQVGGWTQGYDLVLQKNYSYEIQRSAIRRTNHAEVSKESYGSKLLFYQSL